MPDCGGDKQHLFSRRRRQGRLEGAVPSCRKSPVAQRLEARVTPSSSRMTDDKQPLAGRTLSQLVRLREQLRFSIGQDEKQERLPGKTALQRDM